MHTCPSRSSISGRLGATGPLYRSSVLSPPARATPGNFAFIRNLGTASSLLCSLPHRISVSAARLLQHPAYWSPCLYSCPCTFDTANPVSFQSMGPPPVLPPCPAPPQMHMHAHIHTPAPSHISSVVLHYVPGKVQMW